MTYRLGVDVGGTFTDVLLIDESSGATYREKTPSTPEDQSIGVLRGVARVCEAAGVSLGQISSVSHGTTVATNAVLEGKGARVGLVTTRGFRQVLQIARSFVPGGLAGWIIWPKPTPLAALEDTVEVGGRIASDGAAVEPLDEDEIRAQLRHLRTRGVDALAISLINSYVNPVHEIRVGELAAEELPDVLVSLSSSILPEMREYERTLTTVANAYVQPQVATYVNHLNAKLEQGGFDGGLYLLRSDGGLVSADTAESNPVSMLMSGPAGGVTGAVWVAEQTGYGDFLTFDMGGTSTDVALVQGLTPKIGRETTVGDLQVRASSVDLRTVGAGGGSIAHVPELTRALRVGPHSAGAVPGPAAYGAGGSEPTVTDANVVLGYLPASLAGGEIVLDRDAATEAIRAIAQSSAIGSVEAAAAGIIDIVNENMLGGLRLVSVQQGFDPRDFALVAYGGAGPLHANAIARLTGSWPVIIPPSPGVLCALGDATTGLREEAMRTLVSRLSELTDASLGEILAELSADAQRSLIEAGLAPDDLQVTYAADLRYQGQGFELPVQIDLASLGSGSDGLGRMRDDFDTEHERLFSFRLDIEPELVAVRATVRGPRPNLASTSLEADTSDPSAALADVQPIWVEDAFVKASVYDRQRLRTSNVVRGPAVITEMDSTTLVLPGHAARVHHSGSLLIFPVGDPQLNEEGA